MRRYFWQGLVWKIKEENQEMPNPLRLTLYALQLRVCAMPYALCSMLFYGHATRATNHESRITLLMKHAPEQLGRKTQDGHRDVVEN